MNTGPKQRKAPLPVLPTNQLGGKPLKPIPHWKSGKLRFKSSNVCRMQARSIVIAATVMLPPEDIAKIAYLAASRRRSSLSEPPTDHDRWNLILL